MKGKVNPEKKKFLRFDLNNMLIQLDSNVFSMMEISFITER
jgi:hypothetical protein